jgi:hypothetical protein
MMTHVSEGYPYCPVFLGAFAKLRKATISFIMFVRPHVSDNSTSSLRIFKESDISVFLAKLLRKFKFHYNRTRIRGTLNEDQYTFLIISRSILLRMRIVSDKS